MSEIEKCPMCDSDLILSGTAHLYYCCTRCMLRCDRKDLPRVAAAMELAKAMIRVKKIFRMPLVEIEGQLNDAVKTENEAKDHVLEVFK